MAEVVETGENEIRVAPEVREKALRATERLLHFGEETLTRILGHANV